MALRLCARRLAHDLQCSRVMTVMTQTKSTDQTSADPNIEADLPVIRAEPRDPKFCGRRRKNDCLRKFGKIPALLNCIPTEDGGLQQQILSIDTTHFLRIIKVVGGTDAFLSHVLHMKVHENDEEKSYRVLPRQLRYSNENYRPNNATFRVLKPDDSIRVHVPIMMVGEENCPGLKKNGFPLLIRRTLRVKCQGNQVPGAIIADISNLDFEEKIFAKDLTLPDGCTFLHVDPKECICKISAFK